MSIPMTLNFVAPGKQRGLNSSLVDLAIAISTLLKARSMAMVMIILEGICVDLLIILISKYTNQDPSFLKTELLQ